MSLIFRKAERKDLDPLVRLMDQLGYRIDREALSENLKVYEGSVYVAEWEGLVVGCLAFHILTPFHSAEKHMRIVSLVVDQEHRGLGIGKGLIALAEEKGKDCTVIELTSAFHREKSHQFYVSLGFKCDGEKFYFRKLL